MSKLLNHHKKWSKEHLSEIAKLADSVQTREQLEQLTADKADYFGRTPGAVAKQMERHLGIFFTQEPKAKL